MLLRSTGQQEDVFLIVTLVARKLLKEKHEAPLIIIFCVSVLKANFVFFLCSPCYNFSVLAASTTGHWSCQNGIFHLHMHKMRWWPSVPNPHLQNQPRATGQTSSDQSAQSSCQKNWKGGGHSFLMLLCASAPSTSIAVWQSWAALWGKDVDQRWTLRWRSSPKLWMCRCETAKPAGNYFLHHRHAAGLCFFPIFRRVLLQEMGH